MKSIKYFLAIVVIAVIGATGCNTGYHSVSFFLHHTESGNYAYIYQKEKGVSYYVNINGKISGPYYYVSDLLLTESGNHAYSYKEKEELYNNAYVSINGEISGPYDYVSDLLLTESGNYAYQYLKVKEEYGGWYVNINGEISGPYDSVQYDLPHRER
ncbi:MAG: hypothetical protein LBO69_05270 [Ignavibacteria bacterium]|jgi:hypothetical protein|nr:hypothetical protein [Ignavibacteria bacterium]